MKKPLLVLGPKCLGPESTRISSPDEDNNGDEVCDRMLCLYLAVNNEQSKALKVS